MVFPTHPRQNGCGSSWSVPSLTAEAAEGCEGAQGEHQSQVEGLGGAEWERGVQGGWWVTRAALSGSGDALVGQTGTLISQPRVAFT